MCATNRNLPHLIAQAQFREDLFYRINVIHLVVPPLRERREDIPMLIDYFLKRFTSHVDHGNGNGSGNGSHHHSPVRTIATDAIAALCEYGWPGNVRQVENVIERLVVTGRREVVQLEDLSPEIRTPRPSAACARATSAGGRWPTISSRSSSRTASRSGSAVYPLYMNREITRSNVRDLVRKGLEEARGNYKIVLRLFNMDSGDYKRFLNFLRKHNCQLPFKEYR